MAENAYKVKQNEEGKGGSVFSWFENRMKSLQWFDDGVPVEHLPKIVFVVVLMIIYIGNSHYADKSVRKLERLKTEVSSLRAKYTTLKANYMFAGKQSEVARKVKNLGLKESLEPPKKIEVKKSEY